MKVYYLRFTKDDFIKDGHVWRTHVVNLYDNNQYKNYSTTKSNYGLDSLGTGVWTGTVDLGNNQTDYGSVVGNRFIDTTGHVTIVSWALDFTTTDQQNISVTLSAFNGVDSSATPYEDEWRRKHNILSGDVIYIVDAKPYSFFELVFDPSTNLDNIDYLEAYIRIEIEAPAVWTLFPETVKVQNTFPEWMALREFNPKDPVGQLRSTPESLGGKVINAIAGEWLNDLAGGLDYAQFQTFIDTIDITQKSWIYQVSDLPKRIWSITGDGAELARSASVGEFYSSTSDEDVFLWNENKRTLYCNKLYTNLLVNGVKLEQSPYLLWNSYDDIGLNVDLLRLFMEDNETFSKRILDVYKNLPGVNLDAFKKTLRREFNLWKYWSATPDSEFVGATPEVLEMKDLEENLDFFAADGFPTQKFLDLAESLAIRYPIGWGYFSYGNAFWDIDGFENLGVQTLPRRFDATPVPEAYLESGVGDGNDLYVFRPESYTGPHNFEAYFKIKGKQKQTRLEYPGLMFDINIYGKADLSVFDNPIYVGNFTIEIVSNGVTYFSNITLQSVSNSNYWDATPSQNSYTSFYWLNDSLLTDAQLELKNKLTGERFGGATPSQIPSEDITTVSVFAGHWSVEGQAYGNVPAQGAYRFWFSDDSVNVLGFGGSSTDISISNFSASNRHPYLLMESRQSNPIGYVAGVWESDKYLYNIRLNGVNPDNSVRDFTLSLPTILWPESTDPNSREYVIEILTSNGVEKGVFTDEYAATPLFYPHSIIAINGNNTWTSGKQYFDDSTTSITFASTVVNDYPLNLPTWTTFEATCAVPVTGVVDQNGPWRNGQRLGYGNTNFNLQNISFDRDDFNLPNTEDYIVTWLGIDRVSDGNVLVWIDKNTVQPAVSDPALSEDIDYPTDCIVETYDVDSDLYSFSPFVIKARLKPGTVEQWYPKVHSGFFYDDVEEFYLYANRIDEQATANSKVLGSVNRQGAPIIVRGFGTGATPVFELTQVAFWGSDATPVLSLQNEETVQGTSTNVIYIAFKEAYDISVQDLYDGSTVSVAFTSTSDGSVLTTVPTSRDREYLVTYTVAKSFYADNSYQDENYQYKTRLVFDKAPADYGVTRYEINYEGSVYDPATPINVPLNTFYTSIDEGFIYIDHDIHNLADVRPHMDPSKILADGEDFSLITVRTVDIYGNPKPYQTFNLYTNFGTLSESTITTDDDGFASAVLYSEPWSSSLNPSPSTPPLGPATPNLSGGLGGKILFDGPQSIEIDYSIKTQSTPNHNLVAVPSSDHIPADGNSEIYIFGKVLDGSNNPVPHSVVYWKKDRYLYNLFSKTWSNSAATPGRYGTSGSVTASSAGLFSVGPFVAATPWSPGHWLVSLESSYATPVNGSTPRFTTAGDIVYWQEYSDTSYGVESFLGVPETPAQYATPPYMLPLYSIGNAFPVTIDEENRQSSTTSAGIVWTPPKWYAIDKYKQYQMGLLGSEYWKYNQGATPNVFPEYKEF